jgi:flagellar assembly protein FliH
MEDNPKGKLSAWERWELAAFNELSAGPTTAATDPIRAAASPPPSPPEAKKGLPQLPLPTPEEIESLRTDARETGKAEGYAEGLAAGRAEGLALAQEEAARVRTIADGFASAIAGAEDLFGDNLLGLALDIAQQIVRTSLRVNPELILPTVREAMSLLASAHGHPNLYLHPDDADLVRQHLGEQFGHSGWRISEDPQMARGECRIENAGSRVDATLATRWRRVVSGIGAQSDWLEREP